MRLAAQGSRAAMAGLVKGSRKGAKAQRFSFALLDFETLYSRKALKALFCALTCAAVARLRIFL